MKPLVIAGDTIIDWVISDGKIRSTVGGAGNVVRGLVAYGHSVSFLTVYNPMVYPVGHALPLHPGSITDFDQRNVSVRNYDTGTHSRFRESLKSHVFDTEAFAVICHEDTVVRRFKSFYADVRDCTVRGECTILRMSSSDPYMAIASQIKAEFYIVTHKDKVEVWHHNDPSKTFIHDFSAVQAVDDVGAGDVFTVGFLRYMLDNPGKDTVDALENAVIDGVWMAQCKVQKVGVFF